MVAGPAGRSAAPHQPSVQLNYRAERQRLQAQPGGVLHRSNHQPSSLWRTAALPAPSMPSKQSERHARPFRYTIKLTAGEHQINPILNKPIQKCTHHQAKAATETAPSPIAPTARNSSVNACLVSLFYALLPMSQRRPKNAAPRGLTLVG